jgi:hypothetical protein
MRKILLILILLFGISAEAADRQVGAFASKCSALFLLMSMLTDEQWKPFADNMTELSNTMSLVSSGISEENNKALTYDELIDGRNIQADRIINLYKRNPSDVVELYARCDQFRENFAYAAMQNSSNESALLNSLTMPPQIVEMNEQKTGLIDMALETAFADMKASGISSIVELYKKIRNP